MMQTKTKSSHVLGMASAGFALVAVPSFVVFFVFSLITGGDALNGFSTEGRYFVSSHGNDTEVSWLAYTISWYLGSLTLATFIPMVLLGAASNCSGPTHQRKRLSDIRTFAHTAAFGRSGLIAAILRTAESLAQDFAPIRNRPLSYGRALGPARPTREPATRTFSNQTSDPGPAGETKTGLDVIEAAVIGASRSHSSLCWWAGPRAGGQDRKRQSGRRPEHSGEGQACRRRLQKRRGSFDNSCSIWTPPDPFAPVSVARTLSSTMRIRPR